VLLRVNEQRNILHEIWKRKANWIGHILRRNCLLTQVIGGKIKRELEVAIRRGRRRKKLLDDRRGYSHLREEDLDRTMWRHRFGGGFGPVVRQNIEWMNESLRLCRPVWGPWLYNDRGRNLCNCKQALIYRICCVSLRLLNVCVYVIRALLIQMKRRSWWSSHLLLFSMGQYPLVDQGVLIIEFSLSNSDTPHSTGLLWTSDRLDVGSSIWQHTTLTTDRHPNVWRDSNPQS